MRRRLFKLYKSIRFYTIFLISLLCCFITLSFTTPASTTPSRTELSPVLPSNYSKNDTITSEISQKIELTKKRSSDIEEDTAIIYTDLAYKFSQNGQISEAISQWLKAQELYQKLGNKAKLAAVLVDRAQAHNSLGQINVAIPLLNKAIDLANDIQDTKVLATAWGVLGNSYSSIKKYGEALDAYQTSLIFAKSLDKSYTITALNNQVNTLIVRGNWYAAQAAIVAAEGDKEANKLSQLASQDREKAKILAIEAVKASFNSNNLSEVKALLNILRIAPQKEYSQKAKAILIKLPNSRNKAYSLIKLSTYQREQEKINSLEQANTVSNDIKDFRTQSFALGNLGYIYEQQQDFEKALNYTHLAILAAQKIAALDSLYKWQWQIGRIYSATEAKERAIDAYKQAIASLQTIRSNTVSTNDDLQFDVKEKVEPVYRQLVQLMLEEGSKESAIESLKVIKLLKLTELQNFFGDECIKVSAEKSPQKKQLNNSAIVSTIILSNKTYVILQKDNQVIKYFSIPLSSTEIQNKAKNFRFEIEGSGSRTQKYIALAQEFYDLLIRPIETELENLKPSQLTFVNDGILRNIPMASLHDGKQFLVEKYAISVSLGVTVKLPAKKQKTQEALIFGLSVAVPPLTPLANVVNETNNVLSLLGGDKYLNEGFTSRNVQSLIQKSDKPIIHIATHGIFSGTTERTFLQAYDKQISLKEFEQIINTRKDPIELLTLSACQTAAGDNRSTLGLAGIAVRNNVENVLASLWSLNDERTMLPIEEFYRQLKQPNITKAEALRNAQIKMIKNLEYSNPAIWGALVLVSK